MEYSEEMTTSIQDLRNQQQYGNQMNNGNLGQRIENELDNFDYNPDVIPQATLHKAPPMRQGRIENFPTHQVVRQNNFYPQLAPTPGLVGSKPKVVKKGMMEGVLSGLYQRILDPILITILFIIFAHRIVAKGSNPYLPFVGMSPSTDFVSLGLRGFILSIIYLMIRSQL
jgi:hypothetical protein